MSRRHAELKVIANIAVLIDLDSASGTRVNGQTLKSPASLQTGDRIEIGPLSLTALLDERKPSRPRRFNVEDAIVSWLTEEGEEVEPAAPRARRPNVRIDPESARGTDGSSLMDSIRPPAGGVGEEAFELLKAMMARPD